MDPVTLPRIDLSLLEAPGGAQAAPRGAGADFGKALGDALASVEKLQTDADAQSLQVALGGGNLHEAAIALEQADIAIRAATKVRNKLVEAYQDVMRMSI